MVSSVRQLVMPGEKKEIAAFLEEAVNNTLLLVDFSLPNVHIQLPSKLFVEVLYNRCVGRPAVQVAILAIQLQKHLENCVTQTS